MHLIYSLNEETIFNESTSCFAQIHLITQTSSWDSFYQLLITILLENITTWSSVARKKMIIQLNVIQQLLSHNPHLAHWVAAYNLIFGLCRQENKFFILD